MKSFDPQQQAEFDQFADRYDELHTQNLAASGEGPAYFAQYKCDVITRLLGASFAAPILDFGCGIGNVTHLLAARFGDVHGYDPSSESTKLAQKRAPGAVFYSDPSQLRRDHFGAVILSNILHHVPVAERAELMRLVNSVLAPGGRAIIIEHNPLNPLTRRTVNACAFDENAVLLYPWQSKALLRRAGLRKVSLDYIVFFPHALAALRPLEPRLGWLPIGAQVCASAVK